jgi:two-component system, sensor histidine kinase and response regulator
MNDYLAKPIDPDSLFTVLVRWAGKRLLDRQTPALEPIAAAANLTITGLDTIGALRRAGGNLALYKRLLSQFASSQANAPQQVHDALAAENPKLAERIAHSVKGVAATIGASELATLAGQVERAAASGAVNGQLLGSFSRQMQSTVGRILHALPEPSACSANVASPSVLAASDDVVETLSRYLANGDGQVLEYFVTQRSALKALFGSDVAGVEAAINDFDFQKATEQLDIARAKRAGTANGK